MSHYFLLMILVRCGLYVSVSHYLCVMMMEHWKHDFRILLFLLI